MLFRDKLKLWTAKDKFQMEYDSGCSYFDFPERFVIVGCGGCSWSESTCYQICQEQVDYEILLYTHLDAHLTFLSDKGCSESSLIFLFFLV